MSLYLGENLISGQTTLVGESRNVGEIIQSSLPLTDAGLHLLDGTRLSGDGIYKGFVDYIANLYNDTKVYNPSAFTVVGSPTITADGIASGFSSSNYIQLPDFDTSSNFEIVGSFIATNTTVQQTLFSKSKSNSYHAIYLRVKDKKMLLGINWNGTSWGFATPGTTTILKNTRYFYKIKRDETGYKLLLSTDGINYTTEIANTYSTSPFNDTTARLGIYYTLEPLLYGSIDLKQFSITVDGVEVFSGGNPANYFCTEAEWQTAVSTYGVCGKFVYDSVNNSVRLPKIIGIIEGTTDLTALGDLVEAGLPNITGTLSWFASSSAGRYSSATQAFSKSTISNVKDFGNGTYSTRGTVNFDASDSNSIYGNSTTVQPQTIKVLYYIVIGTSVKTDIQVDIDNIATDLNGKADIDLTNTTNQAKILMSGMGMPSDAYVNLTLGASGSTYTAPANGWFYISKKATANAQWGEIINTTNGMTSNAAYVGNGGAYSDILPVFKNDVIQINYTLAGTLNAFRFIYAKGSESEVS